MNAIVVIAVTVLLIVLSAFFVVIEFALLGARQHRLETEATSSASARAALRGMNELTIMLAVAQLGVTACTLALGAVTKPAVDQWLEPLFTQIGTPAWLAGGASFAISLLLVTMLHLVVGEMAPKSWAIAHPELAAKVIGIPSRALAWLFRPLLTWINAVANRLVAASGVTPVDRAAVGGQDADTIRQLVEHSSEVGSLDEPFHAQLSDLLDLRELTVGDLAPKGALEAVGEDATVADVHEAAARSGHLRIFVGDLSGGEPRLVHVRDTLLDSRDARVASHTRPCLVLSNDTLVHEALGQMRDSGEQLAVVQREHHAVGVITMTDILRRVLPTGQKSPA